MSARRGVRACLVTSTGAVAAAAAAHVGAGGAVPSRLLLGLLVLLLAGGLALLPTRLRTLRVQLLAAVSLQPVLHVLFELLPGRVAGPGRVLGAGLALMLVAHAMAAAVAWWLLRSADRLVLAGATLAGELRALVAALAPLVPDRPLAAPRQLALPAPQPLTGRVGSSPVRRRGPPVLLTAQPSHS